MLTGKELGSAIGAAITLKGVKPADVARHFGVKPPSVNGWVATGRIGKDKLSELFAYFSDVVGPDHWGMPVTDSSVPSLARSAPSDTAVLTTSYTSSNPATRELIDWLLAADTAHTLTPDTSRHLLALLRGLAPARALTDETRLLNHLKQPRE